MRSVRDAQRQRLRVAHATDSALLKEALRIATTAKRRYGITGNGQDVVAGAFIAGYQFACKKARIVEDK